MLNGDGYPVLQFRRDCHEGSKLVHVCDVYDALRTNRPYREAWPQSKTLSYIEDRAGTEFDPELAGAFVRMMRQFEPQGAVLTDERAPVRSEEHTSELQSLAYLVCRLLLEKKKK